MATQIKTKKGFLIIKMTWKECVAITDSWGLADCCGQNTCEEDLYYIAILDQFYCEPCYNAWVETASRYKSELGKEQVNFIKIRNKLQDLGTWETQKI